MPSGGNAGGRSRGSGSGGILPGSTGGTTPGGSASPSVNLAVASQYLDITAADMPGSALAAAIAAAPMYEEARPGSGGANIAAYQDRRISRLETDTAILKAKVA